MTSNPPADLGLNFADFLPALFRHKRKLLVFYLLVITFVTLAVVYCPRAYQSEARLFLRVGRETIGLDPTATTGQTIALQQSGRDDEVVSLMEVFRSRSLCERVVEELTPEVVLGSVSLSEEGERTEAGVSWGARAWNQTAGWLLARVKSIDPVSDEEEAIMVVRKGVTIDAERKSSVISIGAIAESPALARKIVQTLLDAGVKEHLRVNRHERSEDFFAQQSQLLKAQFEEGQHALQVAKDRMGLASIAGRLVMLESQQSVCQADIYATEKEISSVGETLQALQKELASTPPRSMATEALIPNSGADALRSQLYALQMELMALRANYREDHPKVVTLQGQVQAAQQELAGEQILRTETTSNINPVYQQLEVDFKQQLTAISGLKGRLEKLQDQRVQILEDLKQLNANEVEVELLTNQRDVVKAKYLAYTDSLEQARIDEALENQSISNVNIIQQASFVADPVSPSKLILAVLGVLVMLAGSFVLVFVFERADSTLRAAKQVEAAMGVPVLATIPARVRNGRILR